MIRREIMREYSNHDDGATAQLELPGDRTMVEESMSGAESLVHTLAGSGVDTCFTNPGTSEMHFVAALDRVPGVRCVLALFEGVATGAADGYARITRNPRATRPHCGPGLPNGRPNLHNAQRARVPRGKMLGAQATTHRVFDPRLLADF